MKQVGSFFHNHLFDELEPHLFFPFIRKLTFSIQNLKIICKSFKMDSPQILNIGILPISGRYRDLPGSKSRNIASKRY